MSLAVHSSDGQRTRSCSFRILFNAVLYSQPVAGAADPTSDFWSAPPEEEGEPS